MIGRDRLGGYVYATNTPVQLTDPTGLFSLGSAWNSVKTGYSAYKTVKKAKGWLGAAAALWDATLGYKGTTGGGTNSPASESARDSVCYADVNVGKAHVSSADMRGFDASTAGVIQMNANAYGGGLLNLAKLGGMFSSGFLGANPTKVSSSSVKNGAKLVQATRSYTDKQNQIVNSCLSPKATRTATRPPTPPVAQAAVHPSCSQRVP